MPYVNHSTDPDVLFKEEEMVGEATNDRVFEKWLDTSEKKELFSNDDYVLAGDELLQEIDSLDLNK
jgi:hypothetical protein